MSEPSECERLGQHQVCDHYLDRVVQLEAEIARLRDWQARAVKVLDLS